MTKKMESIQALRGILFLGIFTGHAGLSNAQWGAVSTFFVLSGFLMIYNYFPKLMEVYTLWECAKFSWKKIRRLYPLHIMTTAMALPILIVNVWGGVERLAELLYKIIVNILLIQSWFPDPSIRQSMNMVSWYLSVCAFLYFLFPWILVRFQSFGKEKESIIGIVVLFFIQLGVGVLINWFIMTFIGDEKIVQGLTYNFPIFRLFDFLIGCNLGYFYRNENKYKSYKKANWFEIITIILLGCNMYIVHAFSRIGSTYWWTKVSIHILPSCLLVYCFAKNIGFITKICVNQFCIYLGNLSGFAFLIHELVLRYIKAALKYTRLELNKWIVGLIAFMLTILFSQIWSIINKKLFYKKRVS